MTSFASSVSRNMDRLSLDPEHLKRQETVRRQQPKGLRDGLKQGLTGFGFSLLGENYPRLHDGDVTLHFKIFEKF